jgi:hypothetical protein
LYYLQDEANWTRHKLAETMMMLRDSQRGTHDAQSTTNQVLQEPISIGAKLMPTKTEKTGRYDIDEQDGSVVSDDYSEDFDVSHIDVSMTVKGQSKTPTSLKPLQQPLATLPTVQEHTLDNIDMDTTSPKYLPRQVQEARPSIPLRTTAIDFGARRHSEYLDLFTDTVARSFMASQVTLTHRVP